MASVVRVPRLTDPLPRSGSCVAVVDHCMYVWGGHTQLLFEGDGDSGAYPVEEGLPDHFINAYDIVHNTWLQHSISGDIPDLGNGSALIAFGHLLFLFGGWNDGDFSSDVYCLDTISNIWEIVALSDESIKPSPRYLTGTVLFDDKLCSFGGVGPPVPNLQPGATYTGYGQHGFNYGFGWNNEMFFYSINDRKWTIPHLVGQRPPPCGGVTFTMIDLHRALLFGGRQETGRVSSVYIFDFRDLHWSTLFKSTLPDEPWPAGRTFHTSCCLVDPMEVENLRKKYVKVSQKILMLWGKGNDDKHCQDAWLLDVDTMSWKLLNLDMRPRMWHMACSYHMEDNRTDVILFGGNIRRRSQAEKHVQTGLTIFSFGVLTLKQLCLESIQRHHHSLQPALESYPMRIRNLTNDYIEHFSTVTM